MANAASAAVRRAVQILGLLGTQLHLGYREQAHDQRFDARLPKQRRRLGANRGICCLAPGSGQGGKEPTGRGEGSRPRSQRAVRVTRGVIGFDDDDASTRRGDPGQLANRLGHLPHVLEHGDTERRIEGSAGKGEAAAHPRR